MLNLNDQIKNQSNNYELQRQRFSNATNGCPFVTDPYLSLVHPSIPSSLTVSVVIPAWNMADVIKKCLYSIEFSSFNLQSPDRLEVIVVDDGSTDGTWNVLTENAYNLNMLAIQQEHMSRSCAINLGVSYAQGDVIISCDADMLLFYTTITELVKRHQYSEKSLFVGFRANIDKRDNRINSDKELYNLITRDLPPFEKDERFTYNSNDLILPGWPLSVCIESNHFESLGNGRTIWMADGESYSVADTVYGALFSLPRKDWLSVGGFDERFIGWGYEDTNFAARCFAQGNKIIPVYSAVGWHIAHDDRSANKKPEAERNKKLYKDLLSAIPSDDLIHGKGTVDYKNRANRFYQQTKSSMHIKQDGQDNDPQQIIEEIVVKELLDFKKAGMYYFRIGNYKKALSYLEQNSTDNTFNENYLIAKSKLLLGDRGAYELLERSVKELKDGRALIDLCFIYADQNRFDLARTMLALCENREPNNLELFYIQNTRSDEFLERGIKHFDNGFYKLAMKDFNAHLIISHPNTEIYVWREKCKAALSYSK